MAGFDDDDFSLSGLMQEEHDFVTVIESSSSDDENYDGLLKCACQLAGETDKSSIEGGMQAGVVQGVVEPGCKSTPLVRCGLTLLILLVVWHCNKIMLLFGSAAPVKLKGARGEVRSRRPRYYVPCSI